MRRGPSGEPISPIRRCRLPEPPKSHTIYPDPVQQLFAFAWLQEQQVRRQAEEEQRKEAEGLSEVIAAQHQIAASESDLDSTLEFLAVEATRITRAGGAAIAIRQGGEVVCRGRGGLLAPEIGARLDPESGISGECLRSGEVLACEDTEVDTRVNLQACRRLGVRSILALPLKRNEESLGILEVFSGWAGVFTERDIRALKLLAGLVVEALWREELRAGAAPPRPQPEWTPPAVLPPIASPEIQPQGREEAEMTAEAAATVPQPERWVAEEVPTEAPARAEQAEPAMVEPAAEAEARELQAPNFGMVGGEPRRTSTLLLAVLLVLSVVSGAAVVAVWRSPRLRERILSLVRPSQARPIATVPQAQAPPSAPAVSGEQAPAIPAPAAPVPGPGQVMAIQYWSKADSTSVGIFLDAPVAYDSGALTSPDRIFFDLKETSLSPQLGGTRNGKIIEVNDALVRKIRVGPREPGVARVVIDLKVPSQYSAVLSPAEPYRLMIAIRAVNAGAPPAPQGAPAQKPAAPPSARMAPAEPEHSPATARGLKIVIDPGHGGSETGAIGRSGLKEKDLVLGVAKRLGELLTERLGAEVIYTRSDDRTVPLEVRAEMANRSHADLFISVHANSSDDPSARGVETYYTDSSPAPEDQEGGALAPVSAKQSEKQRIEESRRLAGEVQQALYGALSGGKQTLRNRGVKKAPFTVLLDTSMPSVLAEIAFVTSPTDERKLKTAESQETVAQALYRGIARYVSGTKRGKMVASLGSAGTK